MRLIRNNRVVEDNYSRIADDAPLPGDGAAIISAERLLANADDILRRRGPTGVAWPNNRRVAELASYLDRLALVALSFPFFKDGRGYSQARLLRERYGFSGELRATGHVLRDQFLFMVRAGFDSLEVAKDADAERFAATLARYSVFYQPTAASRASAARKRLSRVATTAPREAVF
jgi:uncharacterized protein (DUF934 family)